MAQLGALPKRSHIIPERLISMICTVKMIWDDEAQVWYTSSDDIPGLCLEADTFDGLVEQVRLAAAELLEYNCQYEGPIQIIFESVRIEKAKVS